MHSQTQWAPEPSWQPALQGLHTTFLSFLGTRCSHTSKSVPVNRFIRGRPHRGGDHKQIHLNFNPTLGSLGFFDHLKGLFISLLFLSTQCLSENQMCQLVYSKDTSLGTWWNQAKWRGTSICNNPFHKFVSRLSLRRLYIQWTKIVFKGDTAGEWFTWNQPDGSIWKSNLESEEISYTITIIFLDN